MRKYLFLTIAALCSVTLLAACGDDSGGGGGADGLPKVSGAAGAKPTIAIPTTSPAPKQLVTSVVTEGSGPVITAGQTLTVHYVGQIWNTGKQFDASWDTGSPAQFPIGVGRVVKGWDEGLVGRKVGSRVLLVIPPDKGYGSAGRPPIGGTDTMVFVVDLISAK